MSGSCRSRVQPVTRTAWSGKPEALARPKDQTHGGCAASARSSNRPRRLVAQVDGAPQPPARAVAASSTDGLSGGAHQHVQDRARRHGSPLNARKSETWPAKRSNPHRVPASAGGLFQQVSPIRAGDAAAARTAGRLAGPSASHTSAARSSSVGACHSGPTREPMRPVRRHVETRRQAEAAGVHGGTPSAGARSSRVRATSRQACLCSRQNRVSVEAKVPFSKYLLAGGPPPQKGK